MMLFMDQYVFLSFDSYFQLMNIIILMMMDSKETQVKRITD